MVGIAAGRGACPAQHGHSSARCCAHAHKYHSAPIHKVVSTNKEFAKRGGTCDIARHRVHYFIPSPVV